MYQFPNSGVMIESPDDLPYHLIGAQDVYLDCETTSGNPKKDSLNTWHNCGVAGIAFSADDYVYYIPYMHWNATDKLYADDFIWQLLSNCKRWINHNIKYDMHVLHNNKVCDIQSLSCQFVDTMTTAKLIDSDRMLRGGYGLDALSKTWCGHDIDKYGNSLLPYISSSQKDYGKIPADILGEYACEDIFANKLVHNYIESKLPEQCRTIYNTEIELTRNLFNVENNGLQVDVNEIKKEQWLSLSRRLKIELELESLVGRSFNPVSSDDCFDVFCNQYGLPILAYTKDAKTKEFTSNPSFDKHALDLYDSHPMAPKGLVPLVKEYRALDILDNLFLTPWQELQVNELLHSSYNQTVRTGRMSCSDPNAQQLSSKAKLLIHPKPGYVFVSIDYSQIELRTIVHYVNDEKAIAAFKENPDTDFHQWVADMIGIKRKAAKTINFAVAFGEGKAKLIKQLSTDKSLVGGFLDQVDALVASGKIDQTQRLQAFNQLATAKANEVYDNYHKFLPGIKPTSKNIEQVLKSRGYVFCVDGRHRHLPFQYAYRAFNTVNQGSAAGIMKDRANALCRMIAGTPVEMCAIVHDEFLFQVPISTPENLQHTIRDLVIVMEDNPFPLSVPIRCSAGYSEINWAEAGKSVADGGNGAPVHYVASDFNNLNHLR